VWGKVKINNTAVNGIASGTVTTVASSGTVTFAGFASPPAVFATVYSGSITQVFMMNIYNITTSGFSWYKVFAYTNSGPAQGAAGEAFNWIAIGY
jgi:hypothetical protein